MDKKDKIPEHLVIIPDGNRRWAKNRNMKPWEGHMAGAEKIEELAEKALDLGIKNISFWGSSSDNLKKRPIEETRALLKIYEKYFKKLLQSKKIYDYEVKINIIGNWRKQFPRKLKNILEEGIKKTEKYSKRTLNFFLAYNGDEEMIEAIKSIVKKVSNPKKVNGTLIKNNLLTKHLPAVDFMIRTGGEPHLSAGFMMWDMANAQLYFCKKLFPDFGKDDLTIAIKEFSGRERRVGK